MPDYAIRVKPITTAPKTPNEPQGRDTFETPAYAVDLLVPFMKDFYPANGKWIWECACGNLKITNRLLYHKFGVFSTDIRFTSDEVREFNFVKDIPDWDTNNCVIITNPPYSIKEQFIDKAFEYGCPFAFLINADYSGRQIDWIKRGCEKMIANRRIDYITPTGRQGKTSASQFHSMWLCYKFGLGRTETFVELSLKDKKENI